MKSMNGSEIWQSTATMVPVSILVQEYFDETHSYIERFKAVLSVQQVARFYQLENKLDAEVDAQLALIVPLVE